MMRSSSTLPQSNRSSSSSLGLAEVHSDVLVGGCLRTELQVVGLGLVHLHVCSLLLVVLALLLQLPCLFFLLLAIEFLLAVDLDQLKLFLVISLTAQPRAR